MRIDLNADVGEERGDDDALLPFLSSANIACGAHAGGARAMDACLAQAAELGLAVGAHVSYEDREHFGRIARDVPEGELTASLLEQVERLQTQADRFGLRVRYVKPHGALYHQVARHSGTARALVTAMERFDPALHLLAPRTSVLLGEARNLTVVQEFFADRGYHLDGRLVDRADSRAHITGADEVAARTLRWLREGVVATVEGADLTLDAASICLHGDTPGAVASARLLRSALTDARVRIAHWADA